jgi:hypothetical protein
MLRWARRFKGEWAIARLRRLAMNPPEHDALPQSPVPHTHSNTPPIGDENTSLGKRSASDPSLALDACSKVGQWLSPSKLQSVTANAAVPK